MESLRHKCGCKQVWSSLTTVPVAIFLFYDICICVVGLQGALLSNFITPLVINSVTISNLYIPEHLTRAFCCRFDPRHARYNERRGIVHPWMQHGAIDGINRRLLFNDWRNIWSIYWCHEGLGNSTFLLNFYLLFTRLLNLSISTSQHISYKIIKI